MLTSRRLFVGNERNQPSEPTVHFPVLEWIDNVETKHRFRYESELGKGSHGFLRSTLCVGRRKTFPKVKLLNYEGRASVRVKLLTPDGEQHVHKLITSKKESDKPLNEVVLAMSDTEPKTVEIKNLGIMFIGKEKLDQFCGEVIRKREVIVNDMDLREKATKYRKELENVVVLSIEAIDENEMLICPPLYSNKIKHSRSPNASTPNIGRVSKVFGLSKGGDDVFIFCSRVQEGDIIVRFFEIDPITGNEMWQDEASIEYVHHEVAVSFKTPCYPHMGQREGVDVQFELFRRSDGERSQPLDFKYIPDDLIELQRKKRKTTTNNFHTQSSFSSPGPGKAVHSTHSAVAGSLAETNFVLEEDELAFLKNESADPILGGSAELDELLSEHEFHSNELDLSQWDNAIMMIDSIPSRTPFTRVETKKEANVPSESNENSGVSRMVDTTQDHLTEPGTGLAYRLALSTARALHDFSRTGDVRFLLASMRHLIAVQDEHGDNAIHSSVIHIQGEALRDLVEVARTVADYDILNMYNEIKQTPLHIAVYTHQTKVIEVLLYHGANPNLADSGGNTPVHMAAQQGSADCLDALLNTNNYAVKYESHVPDLNAYNFSGYTALHLAVITGSESSIRSLLAIHSIDVDLLDRTNGRSALHLAVERNNIVIIRLLLEEAGAETDIHMFNGNTPLHLACAQDHLESISLLIRAHADPYLENLEFTEDGITDGEASVSDGEGNSMLSDIEVRGLNSLDLARSDVVRRLLRGEIDPTVPIQEQLEENVVVQTHEVSAAVAVKHKEKVKNTPNVHDSGIGLSGMDVSLSCRDVEEEAISVPVAMKSDKPENKPNVHDSGIGLSGTNLLACRDDDDVSVLRVMDILDENSKSRLSRLLDRDEKWKKVASILGMKYMISLFQDSPTSPSLSIMGYAKMDQFHMALEKLNFLEEMKVLEEAKHIPMGAGEITSRMTDQIEKEVQQLQL